MLTYKPNWKIGALLGSALMANSAFSAQFSFLDPDFTQAIYTAPSSGLGLTWAGGNLITRDDIGGPFDALKKYVLAPDTTVNGTSVRSFTTHTVNNLGGGRGLTTGLDGKIYANTSAGITRVNPATFAIEQVYNSSAAGAYGIATMPDGKIVHTDSSSVFLLDPISGTDTPIYNAFTFIDGISVDPNTGAIFLAALSESHIRVIDGSGALINNFAVSHAPDGMAFSSGSAFANNTDGTITKISFAGPGFTGAATENIFASGGAYGDFATVGPDGALYVTQYGPIGGIHWDDASTDFSSTVVVRIASVDGGGFDPGPGIPPIDTAPEGGALLIPAALAFSGLLWAKRRQRS